MSVVNSKHQKINKLETFSRHDIAPLNVETFSSFLNHKCI